MCAQVSTRLPSLRRAPASRGAFTLVELLVTIAIIGILLGLLLPNLAAVQSTAKAAKGQSYLQAFGKGFLDHATVHRNGAYASGGFDHYRDGDVRTWSWVGDLVAAKYANPGKSLDPVNRGKISEETAFYIGALDGHGKLNELRWADVSKADGSPVDPGDEDHFKGTDYFGDEQTMWQKGFNTNFVAAWHFVRGDNNITSGDHYSLDAAAHDDGHDPEMCPLDGDGPLSTVHLADSTFLSSADRIALLGPAQVGNHDHDHGEDHGGGHGHSEQDVILDAAKAQAINAFVDPTGRDRPAKIGDPLVEGMTDGPAAAIESGLTTPWGTGDGTRKVHTLSDIAPIHKAKIGIVNPALEDGGVLKRMVGGSAPVLFADGHVARIYDTGGYAGTRGDGWLGPFQENPGAHEDDPGHEFVLNASALEEIRDHVWLGRIRAILTPGGGTSE
jgi:prepilin-type N-terminal cleavage/methylation domain-containing protein/prepilin-type processing-associated H-X9-DG protein